MRINQFVAQATGLGRRSVDKAIIDGRVMVNNLPAKIGHDVLSTDSVSLDNKLLHISETRTTLLVNKPVGYVCSRDGQWSLTIYDLIPVKYANLKHVGRLDKDSSGLVLLTDDGNLAHELSHPSFDKSKIYLVKLDHVLSVKDKQKIEQGLIKLDGKPSPMKIKYTTTNKSVIEIELHEGRNRQIRRTFDKLDYKILDLNRIKFGQYNLDMLGNKVYLKV